MAVSFRFASHWIAYNDEEVKWQDTAGTFCEYTSESLHHCITCFLIFRSHLFTHSNTENYNMAVRILVGNDINFPIAAA